MHYYITTLKRMTLCTVAALLLLATMQGTVWANGAGFMWAPATGIPYPVKQKDLTLDKEKVIFSNGKVDAQFWIRNPTTEDITVQMGFPVDVYNIPRDPAAAGHIPNVKLTIEGKNTAFTVHHPDKGPYHELYMWKMTFPANQTTHYRLQYPLETTYSESAASVESESFEYITHTGAYWGKPIGEAHFLYCDGLKEDLAQMKQIAKGSYHSVHWDDNGHAKKTSSIDIIPTPDSSIDSNCVEWTRTNWTPERGVDDIRITWNTSIILSNEPVDSSCSPICTPPVDETLAILARNRNKIALPNDQNILTDSIYSAFRKRLFHFIVTNAEAPSSEYLSYDNMLPHLLAEFDVNIYRYLRNRIMARHGHQFEDSQLRECFKGIEQSDVWTDVDKKNMAFIKKREKQAKARYRRERKKAGVE